MATATPDTTALLRWWHQHQAQMIRRETDFLRNGVLQEIIAIRRRLEVTCPLGHTSELSTCEPHLADLTRLYSLLENFCDRLQSPFSPDSLPLALQHTLQPWQARLQLQAQCPSTWPTEPLELTQLLVLLFKAVLPVLAENPPYPATTELQLTEANNCKTLTFTAHYEGAIASALTSLIQQTVQPFLDTFCLFTDATCDVVFHAEHFFLKLGWQPTIAVASDHPHASASHDIPYPLAQAPGD
ncbi:hypothetical protein [Leptolyngbya iicbica]|uniref:Uncharacterized protein n=1 Tax=Leptolyngbya iicbica LK TaxID=2294035 RepID=A0A4Q7EB64_9CYAN|nr:hypothetical protein [Leptolyngbya sp. LK]RZM79773.1 hypothetical protein DYY88_13870 [Leptolyngbya sp. LK]